MFSHTANSSGFETLVETLPHVAGAQRASLMLQELQMNRSAAIGFAGRNTGFREYLLPLSRGKHHIQRKKEEKRVKLFLLGVWHELMC